MLGRFLGEFLFQKRMITRTQLHHGLEAQKECNQPLGILALNSGFLSTQDVQWILDEQRKTDQVFGQIATETGLLEKESLDQLLTIQAENHVRFGEVLVAQGVLTLEQLLPVLAEFESQNIELEEECLSTVRKLGRMELHHCILKSVSRFLSRTLNGQVKIELFDTGRTTDENPIIKRVWSEFVFEQGQNGGYLLEVNKVVHRSLVYCLLGRETANQHRMNETLLSYVRDQNVSIVRQLNLREKQVGQSTSELVPDQTELPENHLSCRLKTPIGSAILSLF